jgi:hypothetical protein
MVWHLRRSGAEQIDIVQSAGLSFEGLSLVRDFRSHQPYDVFACHLLSHVAQPPVGAARIAAKYSLLRTCEYQQRLSGLTDSLGPHDGYW